MNSRIARYVMLNTFFSLCLYYGFFQGIEKAQTMAYFIAWVCILIGLCTIFFNEKILNSMANETNGGSTLRGFDFIFDLCVITVFIHADAWMTAGFYLIQMIAILSIREKINKIREANIKKQKDIEETEAKKIIKF